MIPPYQSGSSECGFTPVSAVLFGILFSLALAAGCSRSPGEKAKGPREDFIPVATAKVESVPMDRSLPVVGTLTAWNEATLGAQVEGQVEKTGADFGAAVKAGQELALIDTTSYEALARQSAASVAKAKANASNAEQNLKRVLELQKSKISSVSELDSATALAEQGRAEVKAVEAAEAIAQLNLQRSHVKAPFDGTVSERVVNPGDYVKIGSPLFRVVEDAELKYLVQVPERYAGQVKSGHKVKFTVDAWPGQEFEGSVYLISPSVSTVTRCFDVAARVPNPERKLKANTFARGDILVETGVPTALIPLDAVVNFAGVTKVFVIENGAAHTREVTVGRVQSGRQEVLKGLTPGEAVAVSGTTKLYENAKVRLQESRTNAIALSQ